MNPSPRPRLALIAAVIAISTAAPLVRLAAPAPALVVAAARIGLAAAALTFVARSQLRHIARLPLRELLLVVLAGALLGAHFGVWITSLYMTSTAASVALVATQPVFAAVLGALALGDRISRREAAGIAVAALGCAVLAGGDLLTNLGAALGDGLALAGAALAAGYLVVGRALRGSVPLLPYLAAVNLVAAAVLVVAAAVTGAHVVGFSAGVYAALAASAVIPSLVGHTLLNWSVRRTPAHIVSLAILGEPVGASLLTWWLFGEVPPPHAVLGGAVILVGIALGFARPPEAASRSNDAPGRP